MVWSVAVELFSIHLQLVLVKEKKSLKCSLIKISCDVRRFSAENDQGIFQSYRLFTVKFPSLHQTVFPCRAAMDAQLHKDTHRISLSLLIFTFVLITEIRSTSVSRSLSLSSMNRRKLSYSLYIRALDFSFRTDLKILQQSFNV